MEGTEEHSDVKAPRRPVAAYAVVSATLAPVALIGGWTLAATLQPTFDATEQTISALAAVGATDRWVMTTGFVILGICHMTTAAGLRSARSAGRLTLAFGGFLAILVAVFPTPSDFHNPIALVSFLALTLWPVLSGVPTRGIALAATLAISGLMIWFGLTLSSDTVGLSERAVAGAQVLWPLAVVLFLLASRRNLTPETQ